MPPSVAADMATSTTEDVVQEASLRAFRYFRRWRKRRAWFLRIVRNSCRAWRGNSFQTSTDPFDEEQHGSARPAFDPEALLLQTDDVTLIERAMRHLTHRFRRLLVLRELEGLSYRELADAMGIPMGTVMSSLSRARQAFRAALDTELKRCGISTRRIPRTGGRRATGVEGVDQNAESVCDSRSAAVKVLL
jgi:RNA polymerase sigma-70 factor (ECF subfamily)